MAQHNIKGFHDAAIRVTTSGNTYNVGSDAVVVGTGRYLVNDDLGAIDEDRNMMPRVHDNTYNIDGRLIGFVNGIRTFGEGDIISIGADGGISGDHAVYAEGDRSRITNRGNVISTRNVAVTESGENSWFHNFGTVIGFTAVGDSTDDGIRVVNAEKGRLFGFDQGVYLGFGGAHLINHGVIHSSNFAVAADSGNDSVVNDGLLEGTVDLGDGNDVLDTRGGRIHGVIIGGTGDDLLITDNARFKLVESADGGADTVKSTVTYKLSKNVETLMLIGKSSIDGTGTTGLDTLIGNDGDNRLVGGFGEDTLAGGKGNDVLIGDLPSDFGYADTFVFSTGDGHDTVADFKTNEDILDLSGWQGIGSVADMVSHAHDVESGVLIRLGHDSLLITDFEKSDLTNPFLHFRF